MLTKYKIKGGRYPEAKIEEVEVLRETAQCVFVPTNKTKSNPNGERKELKHTEWAEHYDTWELAHAALTAKAEQQVAYARRTLELANSLAGNVNGMKRHNAKSEPTAPLLAQVGSTDGLCPGGTERKEQ